MAYIQKRGENTYRIAVSNGYTRSGKKILIRKTVTLSSNLTPKQREKELDKAAILFEEEVKKGGYINCNLTFEEFVIIWLSEHAEKKLEKKTIQSYKYELDTKILPAIGHIKLKELQPLHIIKFLENLTEDGVRLDGKQGGYSTRTIKYQYQIISSILQTAVFWQSLESNIALRVSAPKGAKMEKRVKGFNEQQTIDFLGYLDTLELKYRALGYVAIMGGLRLEEILALNWNDIDFKDNTININKALSYVGKEQFIKDTTKNESSTRKISMPLVAMQLLKELKLQFKDIRVFNMHYTTPYHWLQKTIKRYNKCHEEKLPIIPFHGLRHTSLNLLIANGTDPRTTAGRAGHADTSTTMKWYTEFLKSHDQKAADVLGSLVHPKRK